MRFFWIFLLYSIVSFAQETAWQSISISDGLSQGMIYDLMQDREGFLWIATKDGLNRYDGYNFKVFTHDPYNENSISGNTCTSLLQDSQGRIWIGTEKDGLNLYDPQSGKFYHANIVDNTQKEASNYNILRLLTNNDGSIWVMTDVANKIFKITLPKGYPNQVDFSHLVKSVSPQNFVDKIPIRNEKQSLGIAYAKGLYNHKYPDFFVGHFNTNSSFFKCLTDHKNRLWSIASQQIYCSVLGSKYFIPFPKGEDLSVLNQLEDGALLITNQRYLWLFKPDDLLKIKALTPENAYAVLPPNSPHLNLLIRDKAGNIWGGTRGYGLVKFNPHIKQFRSYLPKYSSGALFQDQQKRVYFHANYFPSYQFYRLNTETNQPESLPAPIDDHKFGHDALLQDHKQQFWVLSNLREQEPRSLVLFDKNWKYIKQYRVPLVGIIPDFSARFLETSDGRIWIGLFDGKLFTFDPSTEKFQTYSYKHLLPKSGVMVQTYALYQDKNTLWIATQIGLIKATNFLTKPTFSLYKNSKTDRKSLSNDFVSGMINDPVSPDKYLWVSTKGGGLEKLNKQTSEFEHFTEAQGLPNKVVYGIVEGDDHNLWMSTNRGIACLNPKTLIFNNFNKSDGLQDNEFNTNSYYKAPDGTLLFGGINGVTLFKASELNQNHSTPITKIINLKINNQPVEVNDESGILDKPIETCSILQLKHDQNLVTLEFGVMDFTNSVKNRFRYRLDGIDNKWVEAGTNRFANYGQLPAGDYTFNVMGSLNGEVWSKPVMLKIRISPPIYRTWWAYLLYVVLFGWIVYRWYQSQLNRVRLQQQLFYTNKETERLAELDTLKTRFFTNISHEFRTPLTLLVGPLEDLKQKYPQESIIQMMQQNLIRLQTLINQLLDLSKLEAGEMKSHAQQGDIALFLRQLFASFESLAQSKNIIFQYDQNRINHIVYFDADKIEKIITNLLSNAFKFTAANGRITATVEYTTHLLKDQTEERMTLTISDNGIGIEAERLPRIFDRFYQVDDSNRRNYEGTGIGLALVKEMVDVLKGHIEVSSVLTQGTTFKVSIPFDLEQASSEAPTELPALSPTLPFSTPIIAPPKPSSNGTEPILLIVEDNPDLRLYVRSIFEGNYQVIEARDGQEGLDKVNEYLPDIIICDLMMPHLDGFGFCQSIKTDLRTNHIPVIMLTAKASLEDRLEGLSLGADDYISKPFNAEELKIRVQNLRQQRQLLQEKYSISTSQFSKDTEPQPIDPFLEKANHIIQQNLSDSNFNVDSFAEQMAITSVQLRRKIKALTNQTITEYVRNYRLLVAATLLQKNEKTVSEVAYQVGFESLPYFSKMFFEKFGKNPSDWK